MLIVLHPDVSPKDQAAIEARVRELGLTPHAIEGAGRTAIGITGNKGPVDPGHFRELTGVADCIPVTSPYKLVSREVKHEDTVVDVAGVPIGGPELVVMAGPCAVESETQLLQTAEAVARAGARVLRGGAYKPRSSPYAFQGLGVEGLKLLGKARQETGLAVVTEVMSEEDVDLIAEYADIMQVGTRSMENYALLEALGYDPVGLDSLIARTGKPRRFPTKYGCGVGEGCCASSTPVATPTADNHEASRNTIATICRGMAPSARRMPISLVRSATEYAMTP